MKKLDCDPLDFLIGKKVTDTCNPYDITKDQYEENACCIIFDYIYYVIFSGYSSSGYGYLDISIYVKE